MKCPNCGEEIDCVVVDFCSYTASLDEDGKAVLNPTGIEVDTASCPECYGDVDVEFTSAAD